MGETVATVHLEGILRVGVQQDDLDLARYAESIRPGALAMVTPWFKAFPLRGSTNPA